MKKKKIVFFDTWVSGLRFVDILAEILYKDFEIIFLSINKFHDKYLPVDQRKRNNFVYSKRINNNIYYKKIVDIEEYNYSLIAFFQKEKPDIGLTISIHNLEQRWFNCACQMFHVPCVFIMHGIKGNSTDAKLRFNFNFLYLTKRFIFYNLLFYYFKKEFSLNIQKQQSIFSEWKELMFSHQKYKFHPIDPYNVKYEIGFVTDNSDIDHFKRTYSTLNTCKFIEIGPMDLLKIENEMNKYSYKKEFVLFIGQPEGETISNKDYLENLMFFKKYFEKKGVSMKYKPHPLEIRNLRLNKIKLIGLDILNEDISATLSKTTLVIGYFSTLLLTCIKLNYPVVSLILKGVPHPKSFLNKPNSFVYNNINEFKNNFDYYTVVNRFGYKGDKDGLLSDLLIKELKNIPLK